MLNIVNISSESIAEFFSLENEYADQEAVNCEYQTTSPNKVEASNWTVFASVESFQNNMNVVYENRNLVLQE